MIYLNSSPKSVRVAIQGTFGAFHEIAARKYRKSEKIEILPALTFPDVARLVTTRVANQGLMAIENSIAGSLVNNYRLMLKNTLSITGEVFLRIKQNLMAFPNTRIEDLEEVHSHPVALQQCELFFANHPHIKLIEATDTALVAKEIRESKNKKMGAVGSCLAAEIYDLDILAGSIESCKENYTRFLVLNHKEDTLEHVNTIANKVSICFSVLNEIGSIHKILGILANYQVNVTKIQSLPMLNKPWEYFFFLDFVLSDNRIIDYKMIVEELEHYTTKLDILGTYKSGECFG